MKKTIRTPKMVKDAKDKIDSLIDAVESEAKDAGGKFRDWVNGNADKIKDILQDDEKIELLLQKAEKMLTDVPVVGGVFAYLPALVSLVRSYILRKYTDISYGSIATIIVGIIYVVVLSDILPDVVPVVGYLDDAAVLTLVMKQCKTEIDRYEAWRKEQGLQQVDIPTKRIDPDAIGKKAAEGLKHGKNKKR